MPRVQAYKNVKKVKRRDGSTDYYHRLARTPEGKMPKLPGTYGSVEFVEAWLAAEKSCNNPQRSTPENTYEALVEAFKTSSEFNALRPRTQSDYQKVFDWMVEIGGEKAADALEQRHAEILVDRAFKGSHQRFAEYVIQVNRRMYNWVLERSSRQAIWGTYNPWTNVKPPAKPKGGNKKNRAWKPAEVAEVLARAPIGLARSYVLGASGFDASTMHTLMWNDYNNGIFDNDRIKSRISGVTVVPRPLRPILEIGDRPSVRICTNENGLPFASVNSLTTASSRFLRALRDEGAVGAGLTMHGLRHTLGKAIADAGGSLRAIQTALRHSSARMSLHYSEEADRKRALLSVSDAVDQWFIGTPPNDLLAQETRNEKND